MAKKKAEPFDAQAVAIALEAEALDTLIDHMRTSDDDLARNDAAFKLWQIANNQRQVVQ